MTALDHLRTLGRGTRPERGGLLSTAQMSGSGLDQMGEEDIIAVFAAVPFTQDQTTIALETAHHAALISDTGAIVADIYDTRIGRLWRIGDVGATSKDRSLHVAFDADMAQARPRTLQFRSEDHPELVPGAVSGLLQGCEELIEDRRRRGNLRVRGFVVRAFGNAQRSVALLSLFTLSNSQRRAASFDFAVVATGGGEKARWVEDEQEPVIWTPRLF